MPADMIAYLAKAMEWAKNAPETDDKDTHGGLHFYLTKVGIICEGELIGHLVNEDPEWVFRPVTAP